MLNRLNQYNSLIYTFLFQFVDSFVQEAVEYKVCCEMMVALCNVLMLKPDVFKNET